MVPIISLMAEMRFGMLTSLEEPTALPIIALLLKVHTGQTFQIIQTGQTF